MAFVCPTPAAGGMEALTPTLPGVYALSTAVGDSKNVLSVIVKESWKWQYSTGKVRLGVGPNGRNFSKYFSHQCGYSAKQILSICSGHVRSFICHFYLISYFWCLIFMFSHLFLLLQRLQ